MDAETRYAKSGDVYVAYQTVGEGPIDLVLVPDFVWHLEHGWEWPEYAATLRRLASFSRLIGLDKRGSGLSDRLRAGEMPTLAVDDRRIALSLPDLSFRRWRDRGAMVSGRAPR